VLRTCGKLVRSQWIWLWTAGRRASDNRLQAALM
jgi:hypothetical protein